MKNDNNTTRFDTTNMSQYDFNELFALHIWECVENNDMEGLSFINEYPTELRDAANWSIEPALLKRFKVIPENVFFKEYDQILALYRTICKENGYDPKL